MIIAGTGHRPKYCPCKYKEDHPWLIELKSRLNQQLRSYDFDSVISGMALGWDLWLAEEAMKVGIPVCAYVPFEGQGEAWPTKSRERYKKVLDKCETVLYLSTDYHERVFLDRDDKMIEDCDTVFALYNPVVKSGGTYYTYKKALKSKKNVINFWYEDDK
jgi:uncharacterized phage-like protein YoqJ